MAGLCYQQGVDAATVLVWGQKDQERWAKATIFLLWLTSYRGEMSSLGGTMEKNP